MIQRVRLILQQKERSRNALAKKLPDMTKIIIAQRISSVRHADQIIIMDGGQCGRNRNTRKPA